MGVDIYAESGVLFTIDESVDLFFKGLNKTKISLILSEIKDVLKDEEEELVFLKDVENTTELKNWFVSFCQKRVIEDYVSDQQLIIKVWNIIVKKTKFIKLPEISLEYFSSNRYSGYEVPIETVCLVFDDSDLFETKMSKKGEAFAKSIGLRKIKKTSWTVYSY